MVKIGKEIQMQDLPWMSWNNTVHTTTVKERKYQSTRKERRTAVFSHLAYLTWAYLDVLIQWKWLKGNHFGGKNLHVKYEQ